ncbi:MAG: DUF1934 domain-containing protein [Eubacteriales bacterium]
MRRITLRLRSAHGSDLLPPRCGDETELSPEEEDEILDQVLGPAPEEGEEDVTELTTAATLDVADGRLAIRYRESELSGMEGTTTEISFALAEPSLVTVLREGAVRCALILEAGKYHSGIYETPVMPLEVTTCTYSLSNSLTYEGGSLSADYMLRIGGITSTRTRLTAEIRPEE